MTEKNLKITFWALALAMLAGLLLISRDAGISGDEEVHYRHSEMVYNYFSTLGADKSSLDTPQTHLQYYGQTYDNLTTALIHWFGIKDIYGFRHLMSSFSGWLTILVTALFAAWFSGYGAAIFVLLLFAVSPTFLGHSQNNLKDIPFAMAYISSVYFSLKLVFSEEKSRKLTILLLILSIGFAIGIRPGGILVVFYLALFMFLKLVLDWLQLKKLEFKQLKKFFLMFVFISFSGYLLGLASWPYALQNPIPNTLKSYEVMTRFPTTVRQIFEGNFEWSNYLPWHYLPKYMAITIPVIVFAGVAFFLLNTRKNYTSAQKIQLSLLLFTILFPILFVLLKGSNLYGSWRHFLFVYPGIVLISALGFHSFFIRFGHRFVRIAGIALLMILSFHPVKFMAENHPYYYLYYNQFAGGLKGAYGNYETDYYYHSMREGAEWLQEYLKNKQNGNKVIVGGNFPIQWFFRNNATVEFVYFNYHSRSNHDWDYAIVANSYISPWQLKNKQWPPANTIHTVTADGVPVCAVIERITKDDLEGLRASEKGDNIKSALLLQKAFEIDPQNELICYKFAASLAGLNRNEQSVIMLEKCLEINPEYEPALIMLGNQALIENNREKAADYFKKAIAANRKYFDAYVRLAAVYAETNIDQARKVLKDCLKMNSRYKPALQALADSYRDSKPEVAKKYDKIINGIK